MEFHRFLRGDEFVRELDKLRAFRGEYIEPDPATGERHFLPLGFRIFWLQSHIKELSLKPSLVDVRTWPKRAG